MKIYFFSSAQKDIPATQQIVKELTECGAQVFSNLSITKDILPEAEVKRTHENGETLLSKMDGLVVEGSFANEQLGYLVAYAISNHKPVLYLLAKGRPIEESLKSLRENKNSARFFNLKFYSQEQPDKYIKDFVKRVEVISGVEAPMLKFTLRIPPLIDRYLQWKTHNTAMTKADFLRKVVIDEVIKKDPSYQKILEDSG